MDSCSKTQIQNIGAVCTWCGFHLRSLKRSRWEKKSFFVKWFSVVVKHWLFFVIYLSFLLQLVWNGNMNREINFSFWYRKTHFYLNWVFVITKIQSNKKISTTNILLFFIFHSNNNFNQIYVRYTVHAYAVFDEKPIQNDKKKLEEKNAIEKQLLNLFVNGGTRNVQDVLSNFCI